MIKCPSCGEDNPPKFRLCGYCGTALKPAGAAPVSHEVRKTVTLLFVDLQGSTALGERLDHEALHEIKEQYFSAMAAEITRHGGRIEKYIGDAIMAVFGLPRSREDDALRAVRAAAGMQQALTRLNEQLQARAGVTLANRCGINTGEVVANDTPGADQKLATGDAVNVAARLEQAAPTNQVYLGETTWRLVRDAVEAEEVAPLTLKGKTQGVPAWRLVGVHGQDGLQRRHDRPLMGREDDLATLRQRYSETLSARAPRAVTVIGDAGAGKSRLVHELIHGVAGGALVLSGRCLPYGEGITFWPLTMMLREAAGILPADSLDEARDRLRLAVGDVAVADRLAAAIGLDNTPYPLHEINWAARKFFERSAQSQPLVVFVDDIHWAEPAMLELLEHVLAQGREASILLVATARHDLLEAQPQWGTQPGAARLLLRPLSETAARQVVRNLLEDAALDDDVLERIVRAAAGNPLYAEQMLSMLVDSGTLRRIGNQWVARDNDTAVTVPPTIQALLEARLDRLERDERQTVEPAAVVGLEFEPAAVRALVPEALRARVDDRLGALARKQFVRPVEGAGAGTAENSHRFRNYLLRDTVYNGLLKRTRALLHVDFVRWADQAYGARAVELLEVLAYHLEQAHRYFGELSALDAQAQAVGEDAARRFASAARRAAARGDVKAAAGLFGRAAALLPAPHPERLPLLPEWGEALMGAGDLARARSILDEAIATATASGSRRVRAAAELNASLLRLYSGEAQDDWSRATHELAMRLVPMLEAEGAHQELASAWRLVVMVHGVAGRYTAATEAVMRSIEHARLAGNTRLVERNAYLLAVNALQGSTPVPAAIAQVEALVAPGLADHQIEGLVACVLAQLEAMRGDQASARALIDRGRAMLKDLGQGVFAASSGIDLARVELRGGDLERAERELSVDCEFLAAKGETYLVSTMAALLAWLVRDQGRDEEALALTVNAEKATAGDDIESGALWRMVRAPILARAGAAGEATRLAKEAVVLARRTEAPILLADALGELAAVMRLGGDREGAREPFEEALALYEAKGDLWNADRLRSPEFEASTQAMPL